MCHEGEFIDELQSRMTADDVDFLTSEGWFPVRIRSSDLEAAVIAGGGEERGLESDLETPDPVTGNRVG